MKKDETTKKVDYIIGNELCEARIGKGLSRDELAGQLSYKYEISLSVSAIQSYELGRRSISPINLLLISSIIDLDLYELRETVLTKIG